MADNSNKDLELIKEARSFYAQWLNAKRDYEEQSDLNKQLEKKYSDQQKAYKKELETTLKEGEDAVTERYVGDLKVLKDELNAAQGKKDREWSKAKKKRIADEVKPLKEDISVHQEAMWDHYTTGHIPKIFFNRVYVRLFCPRGLTERLILLAAYLVLSLGIPSIIYLFLDEKKMPVLLCMYAAFLIVIGLIYFAFYKMGTGRDPKAMTMARREYDHIIVTKKKIKAVENQITMDQNEDRYDLANESAAVAVAKEKYEHLNGIYKKDLSIFQNETKPQLEATVKEKYEGPIAELENTLKEQRKTFAVSKSTYDRLTDVLQSNYTSVIGKRYMKPEYLEQIQEIIENHQASTIEDAINYIKNK